MPDKRPKAQSDDRKQLLEEYRRHVETLQLCRKHHTTRVVATGGAVIVDQNGDVSFITPPKIDDDWVKAAKHACQRACEIVQKLGHTEAADELRVPDLWQLLKSLGFEFDAARLVDQPARPVAVSQTQPHNLNPSHLAILNGMKALGAVSSETRKTADEIAQAAIDKHAGADAVKQRMAELAKLGLVDSKAGRSGGSWLTEPGLEWLAKHGAETKKQ